MRVLFLIVFLLIVYEYLEVENSKFFTKSYVSSGCASCTISYTDSNGENPRSTVPYDEGYTIYTFISNGSFQMMSNNVLVEYLVVGGGSGGTSKSGRGGVVLKGTIKMNQGLSLVSIGNGGMGGSILCFSSNNGGNTVFGTLTAIGGVCNGREAFSTLKNVGVGIQSSISGISKYYASGGMELNATPNTGNGGSSMNNSKLGKAGSSGIVILKFKTQIK